MTDANAVTTFEEGAAFRNHPLIASAHAAGENRNIFEAFVRGIIGDLAPVGTIEATLAARAAGIAWRLNRAQGLETKILSRPNRYDHDTPLQNALENVGDRQALKLVSRWERELEQSLYKTLDALEKTQRLRQRREAGGETPGNDQRKTDMREIPPEGERKDAQFEGETGVVRERRKTR